MELREIWEIIWRRKWIIIQAVFVIFLTASIGSFLLTPTYETSSKILLKTSDTTSSLLSSIGFSDLSSLVTGVETEIKTYIELSTLSPILEEIIVKLQLRSRDGNLIKPNSLLASNFIISTIFPKPHIEIDRVGDTDLIEIKATSTDPKETVMIANTLAEVFIDKNLTQRRQEYGSARKFIEEQIIIAKADYSKALLAIKEFKIAEKTIDLEEESRLAISKMAELMKEKEDNIIDILETMAKMETLQSQLARESETIVSSTAISENPQIEELKKTLSDLELDLAGTLTEKRQSHPDVQMLKRRIKKAREELRKEVTIFQKSSRELENLSRELAALKAHLKGVNEDIDKYSTLIYSIPGKAFKQSQFELKLSATQALYSSLLEYLYQVGVAEAMTLSDIRLVESAAEPDINKPKSPNKILNGLMGIFLGLMVGFGLAFLVDYIDDTLKTPDDIKERGLTLLGSVPQFRRRESPFISERDPKDHIAESYRTIRNSVKFATLDKPVNTLLITSSIEGEGKTTTMINLGFSISREGKKVLLMDTDLRRPSIHEIFGVSNLVGITTILAAEGKPSDVIIETDIKGLYLLTSGPVPPDPARVVESTKMKQLVKYLAQQYNTVILDSPPILVVNDAIMLAGWVDGLIFVLESNRTTRGAFSQSRELLKKANIEPIGMILNKLKIQRSHYYYYYYKSGYYKDRKK